MSEQLLDSFLLNRIQTLFWAANSEKRPYTLIHPTTSFEIVISPRKGKTPEIKVGVPLGMQATYNQEELDRLKREISTIRFVQSIRL